VTQVRNGSPYRWPLSKLIPLKKYYEVKRLLQSLGWTKKSLPGVCEVLHFHFSLLVICRIIVSHCYCWYISRSLNLLIGSNNPLFADYTEQNFSLSSQVRWKLDAYLAYVHKIIVHMCVVSGIVQICSPAVIHGFV